MDAALGVRAPLPAFVVVPGHDHMPMSNRTLPEQSANAMKRAAFNRFDVRWPPCLSGTLGLMSFVSVRR